MKGISSPLITSPSTICRLMIWKTRTFQLNLCISSYIWFLRLDEIWCLLNSVQNKIYWGDANFWSLHSHWSLHWLRQGTLNRTKKYLFKKSERSLFSLYRASDREVWYFFVGVILCIWTVEWKLFCFILDNFSISNSFYKDLFSFNNILLKHASLQLCPENIGSTKNFKSQTHLMM